MYKNEFKIAVYKEKIEDVENNISLNIKTGIITLLFTLLIVSMSDIGIYSKLLMMALNVAFCFYGFGIPVVKLRRNKKYWESKIEKEEKGMS